MVIDTNVLKHADDKNYHRRSDCIDFINQVMESEKVLVFLDISDQGYIRYEYNKHIKWGMLGYTMLLKIAKVSRIRFKDRSTDPVIKRKINRTGIKTEDRIFVNIAYQTKDKLLISQEHEDFTDKIRGILKKEIDVDVLMAHECPFHRLVAEEINQSDQNPSSGTATSTA